MSAPRYLLVHGDPAGAARHPLAALPAGVAAALATATGASVAVLPAATGPSPGAPDLLRAAAAHGEAVLEQARGHDVVLSLDVPAAAAALAARRLGGPPVLARMALAGLRLDAAAQASVTALARGADALLAPSAAHRELLRPLAGAPPVEALLEALAAHELAAADGGPRPVDPAVPPRLLVLGGAPWSRAVLGGLLRCLVEEPGLTVSVAGPADDAPAKALRTGAERLGVGGRVTWAGDVSGPDLLRELDAATVVLDPGNSTDATLVPLAAMARARAVVAPGRHAAADVVVSGVTGTLFRAEDERFVARAVLGTWRDGFRCSAFGVAGADRLRSRFAAERVLRAVEECGSALAGALDSRTA
ncbi:glycosyltransferase [Kineococcus rubinsiae]|uniref:glycosyltransferase n=1 Tax=Kineococcus rubinsiae TaxID=2609562 RepID=UPI00143149C4|nr:glycosyltransferase [Kineococcus rubinsiae]NIZ89468.1 glycosyltransferase [Kineococcus rubinsiae]